jgi:hypothetical protein
MFIIIYLQYAFENILSTNWAFQTSLSLSELVEHFTISERHCGLGIS